MMGIIMLNIVVLSVIMLSVIMLGEPAGKKPTHTVGQGAEVITAAKRFYETGRSEVNKMHLLK
jgi:hypothetical protein